MHCIENSSESNKNIFLFLTTLIFLELYITSFLILSLYTSSFVNKGDTEPEVREDDTLKFELKIKCIKNKSAPKDVSDPEELYINSKGGRLFFLLLFFIYTITGLLYAF